MVWSPRSFCSPGRSSGTRASSERAMLAVLQVDAVTGEARVHLLEVAP